MADLGESVVEGTETYGNEAWLFDTVQREVFPDDRMVQIINQELQECENVLSGMSGSRPLGNRVDAEVVGADRSQKMAELDDQRKTFKADVTQLPFEDNSFDGMYVTGISLPYLDRDEIQAAFSEASRVLQSRSPLLVDYYRPGSMEMLAGSSEVNIENERKVKRTNKVVEKNESYEWTTFYELRDSQGRSEVYGPQKHVMREYDHREIEEIMKNNGFQSANTKPVNGFFSTVLKDTDKFVYTVGHTE